MYITVPYRSSSAIQSLEVDALKGLANVKFKNGNEYEYENVSKLAIINVLFNEDVSLGFWVNNNLVNTERTQLANDEYQELANRFAKVENSEAYKRGLKNISEPQLPELA